jgi:predicted nucleotidyltransferase
LAPWQFNLFSSDLQSPISSFQLSALLSIRRQSLAFPAPIADFNPAMNSILADHTREIADLCRKYQVLRLDAFGSVIRSDFNPSSSDVDLIAEFSSTREPGYADRYMDFVQSLEALFGRKVDLLTPGAIHNPRFAAALKQQALPIYDAKEHQGA